MIARMLSTTEIIAGYQNALLDLADGDEHWLAQGLRMGF